MNREIYLDNSATTRIAPQVAELMMKIMTEAYGNPSSLHHKGIEAERCLREAGEKLAAILKADTGEIFYTSGGTESDNWAILSGARANRRKGNRVIVSAIEHPAVSAPAGILAAEGYEVITLPVDEKGIVRLDALKEALNDETVLVSVMLVNNEVGSVQPVEEIGKLIKSAAPEALFHVDGVQGFGKMQIHPKKLGIDMLSVSGHKIHGPKGSGMLYVSGNAKLTPYIHGGGQQKNMRSGTENVPGIAGLAAAAELAYDHLEEDRDRLYDLKGYFENELLKLPDVMINGPVGKDGAPHIVNASFLGVRSEVLLHALEDKGIYVSAGSACASHKRTESPTLKAMGLSKAASESALRFSFSAYTTGEELSAVLEAVSSLLPVLRRFTRR